MKVIRYVVAHDCGRVVNPMLVDGQIHGGIAQGIGGGLYEALRYETGQLLTSTLMEYHMPAADEVPFIETIHMESHSSRNPPGVKGVGRAAPSHPLPPSPTRWRTRCGPSGSRSPRRP